MADLFELSASLFLNTSSFEQGLKGVPGLVAKAAGKGVGTAIDGAITLGKTQLSMVTDAAKTLVGDVFEHGLAFEEATGAVFALTQETDQTKRKLFETTVLAEAAESTFTTAEVAAAGMYEALAGYGLDSTTAGLHGLIVTAEAAGEPLEAVSSILIDTKNAFGDTSDDMLHYGDVLAATATNFSTTILGLGQGLKYVAPVSHALGGTIEETSFFLGVLADNATKGSQAGTTLRNIFTRIAVNAGQTNKDLGALDILVDKLGVSFYDTEGKARPLKVVFDEMRAAWAGLDEVSRNNIADQYNAALGGTKEAELTLKEFVKDAEEIKELNKSLNNTKDDEAREKYAEQIGQIGKQYDELLKLLGIPIPETMSGYADAIDKARTKLGLMSNADQIYYAKQIGSLRGMAGVLELLNYDADKWNDKWDAVYNSEGAADKMRQERLNNLRGDLEKLSASYDSLVTQIFIGVREPLRPLVQSVTSAVDDIRHAIEVDGLEGGMKELAKQIKNAGEFLKPAMESLGTTLAPLVKTLITDIGPSFDETFISLGSTFLDKFMEGFGEDGFNNALDRIATNIENLGNNEHFLKLVESIGNLFGTGIDKAVDTVEPEAANTGRKIFSSFLSGLGNGLTKSGNPITGSAGFLTGIMGMVFGQSGGIIGWLFESGDIRKQKQAIARSLTDTVSPEVREFSKGEVDHFINTWSADADTDRLSDSMFEVFQPGNEAVANDLEEGIATGGSNGGITAATDIEDTMGDTSFIIAEYLSDDIGAAGTTAGDAFAVNFQNAINGHNYIIPMTINTPAVHRNAVAMNTGRIYRKPTVFGYADGAFQEAGDAGAEAVVGVNSLQSMIAGAVNSAMGDFIERLDDLISGMPDNSDMCVYIDGDTLVGTISRRMNVELNEIAAWRGSGRS